MELETTSSATVERAVGVASVPAAVRSLSPIVAPDYIDCFTIRAPHAAAETPERWARAIMEEGALAHRDARRLWRLLGLRLGPRGSAEHVQGWKITDHEHDWIRVKTASWYLSAQAVCLVEADQVSLSLSLRYDNRPVAALVWRFVAGPHQRAVPVMLRQAVEVVAGPSGGKPHAD
jgi:hypothetical protein